VTAWSNEVVAVPIDTDPRVSETFITAVKRHVVTNPAFVLFNKMLDAFEVSFFFNGEDKN
jgi:hypothetical protein